MSLSMFPEHATLADSPTGLQALNEAVINTLPVAVVVKDDAGKIVIANEMAAQLIGYPLPELLGKTVDDFISAELARRLSDDDARVRSTGKPVVREEVLDDGRTILSNKRVVEINGVQLLIVTAMDVTVWRRGDALMASGNQVLEMIAGGAELGLVLETLCKRMEKHLPGTRCAVMLLDGAGAMLRVGAAPSLPAEFVQGLDGLVVGASATSCGAAVFLGEQVVVEDVARSPLWADHLDIAERAGVHACWSTPFLAASRRVLGTFDIYSSASRQPDYHDLIVISHATRLASITVERWQQLSELKRLATTDQLTGLFNRAHFMSEAEDEVRRVERFGRPLTALMIDLDHFKRINDHHGHAAGDRALRVFSEILARETRGVDLLGRVGGEEFAVLLPETPLEVALTVAERLRTAVETAGFVFQRGENVYFTVSIGVSTFQKGDSIDKLLARADTALYCAKENGRNRVERG